jgi:hypothetical protein
VIRGLSHRGGALCLVPLAHRLLRYQTMHYELLADHARAAP